MADKNESWVCDSPSDLSTSLLLVPKSCFLGPQGEELPLGIKCRSLILSLLVSARQTVPINPLCKLWNKSPSQLLLGPVGLALARGHLCGSESPVPQVIYFALGMGPGLRELAEGEG